jgi:hypothetical protein
MHALVIVPGQHDPPAITQQQEGVRCTYTTRGITHGACILMLSCIRRQGQGHDVAQICDRKKGARHAGPM